MVLAMRGGAALHPGWNGFARCSIPNVALVLVQRPQFFGAGPALNEALDALFRTGPQLLGRSPEYNFSIQQHHNLIRHLQGAGCRRLPPARTSVSGI